MRLAVVIPVYNEATLLPAAIARLDAVGPPPLPDGSALDRTLILVDDGSTDGTADLVRELASRGDVVAAFHEANRGKGAALRTGFREALEAGCDLAIVQDADLEYDPADHAAALAPLVDGRADAVIGSRFIGQTHRVLYYWHSVANRAITTLSNMASNLNLTDIECGTKAFTRRVLVELKLTEDRFGVEPEIVAKLARLRMPASGGAGGPASGPLGPIRIYEVPVSYAGRTYDEGKKIGWRDGVSALRCIVQHNLLG